MSAGAEGKTRRVRIGAGAWEASPACGVCGGGWDEPAGAGGATSPVVILMPLVYAHVSRTTSVEALGICFARASDHAPAPTKRADARNLDRRPRNPRRFIKTPRSHRRTRLRWLCQRGLTCTAATGRTLNAQALAMQLCELRPALGAGAFLKLFRLRFPHKDLDVR